MKTYMYAPASLVATSLAVVGGGTILVLSMASAVTAFAPPSPQLLHQPLSSVALPAPTHSTQSSALFVTAEEQEDLFLERTMTAPAQIRPDIIYIILFNPQTPFEAIHTVKFPRGANFEQSTADLLLAFESFDDCVAFAEVLWSDPAVDAGEPVATPSSYEQIEQACQKMRLPMKVVPAQASQ